MCPSVRRSVCPSVTSRSCTKMAKLRIIQTTPHYSPETLTFRRQKSRRNFNEITPNGGTKQRWGRFKSSIFDQSLARSHKRCKIGTLLLWKANRNSYALYRMALFSMTLSDPCPNYPKRTQFRHFITFHIFVVGGDREFKLGR